MNKKKSLLNGEKKSVDERFQDVTYEDPVVKEGSKSFSSGVKILKISVDDLKNQRISRRRLWPKNSIVLRGQRTYENRKSTKGE